jgi:hypothetical protein
VTEISVYAQLKEQAALIIEFEDGCKTLRKYCGHILKKG